MWCDLCGYNVTKEDVEERCPYRDCPMPNNPVNVSDELHKILADALNEQIAAKEDR